MGSIDDAPPSGLWAARVISETATYDMENAELAIGQQ